MDGEGRHEGKGNRLEQVKCAGKRQEPNASAKKRGKKGAHSELVGYEDDFGVKQCAGYAGGNGN